MTCAFDADIMFTLVVNCGGVASTFLAVLCLSMSHTVEQSLRAILLSYSISNLAGSGMLVFGIITYVCHHDEHPLDYIVVMAIVLSLSHLLLLIVHYYITLTTSKKKRAVDFSGLIITAWITSAAIGSMLNVSTRHEVGHMVVVVGFLIIIPLAIRAYLFILRKHQMREAIQQRYRDTFLDVNENDFVSQGWGEWNLSLLATMLFTYVFCSVPWLVNEVAGFYMTRKHLGNSVALLMYAFNFYVPSILCVIMGCADCSTCCKRRDKLILEDSIRLKRFYSIAKHHSNTM